MTFSFLTAAAGGAEMTSMIVMLVAMVALMYFMIYRPQKKQQKREAEMRNSLEIGDEVTTIGGIIGRVVAVEGDTLVIETSEDRVRMQITKWAVSTTGVQSTEQPEPAKKEKREGEEPVNEIPAPEDEEQK